MVYNVMLLYICINCEKITMIKLNDFFITSTVILVCVCREDLSYFLKGFHVYTTVLSATVTVLC